MHMEKCERGVKYFIYGQALKESKKFGGDRPLHRKSWKHEKLLLGGGGHEVFEPETNTYLGVWREALIGSLYKELKDPQDI